MTPLLEAKSLTKVYGSTTALNSVDFEVSQGITGILGPNGAGKSTAIKLFLGLTRPTSGAALILGQEPYVSVDARQRIGYMPEHDCLPGAMNASEFLAHMAQISGLPAEDARIRSADTLRHVGLHEERYRPIDQYSTGMKQRVKLAQALVHDPVIILMDEPTAGLDPASREDMLDLVHRIGTDFGISVLLSSHLMNDVERTCDKLIVLEEGEVIQQGTVSGFTQETEAVYVEVDENRDELLAVLEGLDVQATLDGGAIVVELSDDTGYDHIRDAIVESGARLRRMGPRRGTLTDIFRSPTS